MENAKKYKVAITFIWIGFIGAISFMESWLKFRAPGITTELGLGIGQLVFKALNRVEIVYAILILVVLISNKKSSNYLINYFFFVAVLIIVLQTLWLLPVLENRANLIISGAEVPKNKFHLWYVLLEVVKVISLFIYGIKSIGRLKKK